MNENIMNEFQNPVAEREKLESQLKMELSEQVVQCIYDYASKSIEEIISLFVNIENYKNDTIIRLQAMQQKKKITKEAQRKLKEDWYTLVNPKIFYDELREAFSSNLFFEQYYRVFTLLPQEEVIQRYKLKSDILNNLYNFCLDAYSPVFTKLKELFDATNMHYKKLKIMKRKGLLKTCARTLTGVTASMLGGFFVGQGARAAFDSIFNGSNDMKSEEDMFQKFDELMIVYREALNNYYDRLTLVFISIYGGFLQRYNADLQCVNKKIHLIDFFKGKIFLALTDIAGKAFEQWADNVVRELVVLQNEKKWLELRNLANQSLQKIFSDSTFVFYETASSLSYAVFISRYRAIALNSMADEHWNNGELEEAFLLYQELFNFINIAYEPEDNTYDNTNSIFVPALRMVMLSTNTELCNKLNLKDEVEHIINYIFTAMCRLRSEQYGHAIKGECLNSNTILLGMFVIKYYKEKIGIPLKISCAVSEIGMTEHEVFNGYEKYSPRLLSSIAGLLNHKNNKNHFLKWLHTSRIMHILAKTGMILFIIFIFFALYLAYSNKFIIIVDYIKSLFL